MPSREGWSRGRVGWALLAAVVLVTGLAGCVPAFATPDGRAHDAARSGADRLAKAVDDSRPRNVLASDLAYEYAQPGSRWQQAPGTNETLSAEAISWEGQTRDPGGAYFVLRISAHADGGGWGRSSGDWSGCFAFRAHAFFAWQATSVREVVCPPGTPTAPPSPLPAPALPADAADRLSSVLASATANNLAAQLAAAFPDGSVRSDPVSGAHLTRDSGAEGSVLAAAVGISGTTDCKVGTRSADGRVQVWHPQNVTLQRGEAGCTISNALHPVTTH
ncbi:hypothetical protein [Leifsonia sp. SIMBA_070]|uniref:hypothetical protein n=2 Tax=Bacillati TaxID=1783272 RepID=UPI0039796E6F